MRRLGGVLLAVGLLALPPAAWASRCNQRTTVRAKAASGAVYSDLSDRASRICSVEFIAGANGGWAQVFDSPDDTETHAQAVTVSEPGASAEFNGAQRTYGEDGIATNNGLDVVVVNGVAVIQWAGAAP